MPHDVYPAVATLLCSSIARLGGGLDLTEIQTRLQESDPTVHVRIVPGLAQQLSELETSEVGRAVAQSGASRLVLGMSTGTYSTASLQLQARQTGLDALGVEVVNLGAFTGHVTPQEAATEHAVLTLSAAVAKTRAFSGSRPENLKPSVPTRMNRRSLLSLPVLEYSAIPCVYSAPCRADDGCQQCVQACPHGALMSVDGQIQLTKSRCTSCGICMSACPNEAIDLPGATPAQLSAQITSLLAPSALDNYPRGILFLCSNSVRTLENLAQRWRPSLAPNWLPVQVPCVEMLPSNWLLAPLTLGAAAVAVLPCGDGCRSGQSRAVEERVAFCTETLRLLGEPDDRIVMLPSDDEELVATLSRFQQSALPVEAPRVANPLMFRARASVFLELTRSYDAAPEHDVEHPQSPFGVVEATDGCTLCGGCATACPTQALVLDETAEGSSLSFDSTQCIGCANCLTICPEDQVLHLRRTTDIGRLAQGRVVLRQDAYQCCEACGKPIAPDAMSRRIIEILGDEHAATVDIISRYCVECRGLLS